MSCLQPGRKSSCGISLKVGFTGTVGLLDPRLGEMDSKAGARM